MVMVARWGRARPSTTHIHSGEALEARLAPLGPLARLAALALALWASLASLGQGARLSAHRAAAGIEKGATPARRKLLGLPPLRAPCTAPPPPPAPAPPAAVDFGPPLRDVTPIPAPAGGRRAVMAAPSPLGLLRSGATPPGPLVRTPEQLRPYLDAFSPEPDETGGGGSPPAAHGHPLVPSRSPLLLAGDSPAALGGGGALAPSYRPSLARRGAGAGLGPGSDPAGPSARAAVAAAAARLGLGAPGGAGAGLESGTEALREWLAADVLQPLAAALASAHETAASAAAAAGWPGLRLAPLASTTGAPVAGDDDDAAAVGLQASLEARAAAAAAAAADRAPPPTLAALLEAVVRYARLGALLRGDAPRGLLPPCPRGYVAARVAALARGPCVGAFTWNGGGPWNAAPWTPELPTDAALLFHLCAAFVEAPRWEFGAGGTRAAAPGAAALYLGRVPSRPARSYAALLSVRPPAPPADGAALVGLGLGTPEPCFALLTAGSPPLTLGGASGLLAGLLLWFAAAKTGGAGPGGGGGAGGAGPAVGGRSLELLGVARALDARARGAGGGRGWLGAAGRALWG